MKYLYLYHSINYLNINRRININIIINEQILFNIIVKYY